MMIKIMNIQGLKEDEFWRK